MSKHHARVVVRRALAEIGERVACEDVDRAVVFQRTAFRASHGVASLAGVEVQANGESSLRRDENGGVAVTKAKRQSDVGMNDGGFERAIVAVERLAVLACAVAD